MKPNLKKVFSIAVVITNVLYPLAIGYAVLSVCVSKLNQLEEKIDKVSLLLSEGNKQ